MENRTQQETETEFEGNRTQWETELNRKQNSMGNRTCNSTQHLNSTKIQLEKT